MDHAEKTLKLHCQLTHCQNWALKVLTVDLIYIDDDDEIEFWY